MGLYILLAVVSCLLSITFFKKYYWEGESLNNKRTCIILSITLFGAAFPFGLVVIIAYGLVYGLTNLSDKLVKWIDKI